MMNLLQVNSRCGAINFFTKDKLIMPLISILIVLIALEIILRWVGPDYHQFGSKSQEYYTNPRNYYDLLYFDKNRHPVYGLHYQTHPFVQKKIPDTEKTMAFRSPDDVNPDININHKLILTIGDSFTYGRGVRYKDIYTTRLEQLLKKKEQYTVVNRGVSGIDLEEIFYVFKLALSQYKYEYVIYGFVLNDFGMPGYKAYGADLIDFNNGSYTYDIWRKRCALYNFIMHRLEMEKISQRTIMGYLRAFAPNPKTFANLQVIKLMHAMAKDRGAEFILVIFPLFWELNDDYPFQEIHSGLTFFCNSNQIKVLDLFPYYKNIDAQTLWAAPTDHHPNEMGHEIAAKAIYKYLINQ